MRTSNSQIDIFDSLVKANKAFDKSTISCQLLRSVRYDGWYIDRSKQAVIDWPELYTVIREK